MRNNSGNDTICGIGQLLYRDHLEHQNVPSKVTYVEGVPHVAVTINGNERLLALRDVLVPIFATLKRNAETRLGMIVTHAAVTTSPGSDSGISGIIHDAASAVDLILTQHKDLIEPEAALEACDLHADVATERHVVLVNLEVAIEVTYFTTRSGRVFINSWNRIGDFAGTSSMNADDLAQLEDTLISIAQNTSIPSSQRQMSTDNNNTRTEETNATGKPAFIVTGAEPHVGLINNLIKRLFDVEPVTCVGGSNESIVAGAAMIASKYFGDTDYITVPFVAMSIGIEAEGGLVQRILPRNVWGPLSRMKTFTTVEDSQSGVVLRVLEGDEPVAKNNALIALVHISNLPPLPRGKVQLNVTISEDWAGNRAIRVDGQGINQSMPLPESRIRHLLDDVILDKIMNESNPHRREHVRNMVIAKHRVQRFVDSVRGLVSDYHPTATAGWTLDDKTKQKVSDIVQPIATWLDGAEPEVPHLRVVERELREKLKPLIGWVADYCQEPEARSRKEETVVHDEL
ncbi:Major heat shock 70 kDa protein Bb [Borealophlyctis nickersoniae]|nr:Major heat shock 70 kDa protein Bb [Borealophlyctis nickersoniae]